VCIGTAEGNPAIILACDECCGHGNEDGWCMGLADIPALRTRRVEDRATIAGLTAALEAVGHAICSSETLGSLHNIDADAGMIERHGMGLVSRKPNLAEVAAHIRKRRLMAHEALVAAYAICAVALAATPTSQAAPEER